MPCPVRVTVGAVQQAAVIVAEQVVTASTSSPVIPLSIPYTGAYEFTPTDAAQTIEISGKTATENITINAIPSNWGRITWDGTTITVS